MRVLVWQELFWPAIGGAEVMAIKLLLALKQRGHECIVITRQDSLDQLSEDEYQGIRVYRFPFWSVLAEGDIDRIVRIRQEVLKLKRSFAPSIVHVNSFGPSAFFHMNTMNAHPVPCLLTLHSENNLADHGFPRDFLRSADWVVGCSNAILKFATGLAPEISCRSSVIFNGLEPPELVPEALPFDPPRLLCVRSSCGRKRIRSSRFRCCGSCWALSRDAADNRGGWARSEGLLNAKPSKWNRRPC